VARSSSADADGDADGPAAGTDAIDVFAPATTERIGSVPACEASDVVDAAVERAREAQAGGRRRPRGSARRSSTGSATSCSTAMQSCSTSSSWRPGSRAEPRSKSCSTYRWDAATSPETAPGVLADERRAGVAPGMTTATVTYDPVGVVGVISPWNYPLTLSMADALPALVAGNAVVLKPDERRRRTARSLGELLEVAGLPDDLFQVVTGDGPTVGPALIDAVDYVAFTGSTETGRIVAERAGRNLIDCSLELGGNNPLIVLDDTDVDEAARGAVQACFSNAGQLCLSAERIYVVESAYDEFVDAFVRETERLTLGTGYDYDAEVGSLIDAAQLDRVQNHVDDAGARRDRADGRPRPSQRGAVLLRADDPDRRGAGCDRRVRGDVRSSGLRGTRSRRRRRGRSRQRLPVRAQRERVDAGPGSGRRNRPRYRLRHRQRQRRLPRDVGRRRRANGWFRRLRDGPPPRARGSGGTSSPGRSGSRASVPSPSRTESRSAGSSAARSRRSRSGGGRAAACGG